VTRGSVVVDASAVVSMIFDEPGADALAERLEGSLMLAPALLGFEVGNACVTRLRRRLANVRSVHSALELFARFPVEVLPVDNEGVLLAAEASGVTFYDASYLWLARASSAELVTLDARLAAAARRLQTH
jgi:predicted nucleic acid-binding protein